MGKIKFVEKHVSLKCIYAYFTLFYIWIKKVYVALTSGQFGHEGSSDLIPELNSASEKFV